MTKDKALTGAAGAYYVGFRLTAEGYAVGLTAHSTRSIDMVIANPDTGKSIAIQTKTMRKASEQTKTESWWKWRAGTSGRPAHESFFYAFVDLKNDPSQTPDVFIVPSDELIPPLLEEYPNDTWCVIYEKDAPKYQNRWDVIKAALA